MGLLSAFSSLHAIAQCISTIFSRKAMTQMKLECANLANPCSLIKIYSTFKLPFLPLSSAGYRQIRDCSRVGNRRGWRRSSSEHCCCCRPSQRSWSRRSRPSSQAWAWTTELPVAGLSLLSGTRAAQSRKLKRA